MKSAKSKCEHYEESSMTLSSLSLLHNVCPVGKTSHGFIRYNFKSRKKILL